MKQKDDFRQMNQSLKFWGHFIDIFLDERFSKGMRASALQ